MTVYLVRHAAAAARLPGADDRMTPLSEAGVRQAERLAETIGGHPVIRLLSSPYARCQATLVPLASRLGLEVEVRDELAIGAGEAAWEMLTRLESGVVACSHSDVILGVLSDLARHGIVSRSAIRVENASAWAIELRSGGAVSARLTFG